MPNHYLCNQLCIRISGLVHSRAARSTSKRASFKSKRHVSLVLCVNFIRTRVFGSGLIASRVLLPYITCCQPCLKAPHLVCSLWNTFFFTYHCLCNQLCIRISGLVHSRVARSTSKRTSFKSKRHVSLVLCVNFIRTRVFGSGLIASRVLLPYITCCQPCLKAPHLVCSLWNTFFFTYHCLCNQLCIRISGLVHSRVARSTSKRTSFKSKRHVSLILYVSLFYKSQH